MIASSWLRSTGTHNRRWSTWLPGYIVVAIYEKYAPFRGMINELSRKAAFSVSVQSNRSTGVHRLRRAVILSILSLWVVWRFSLPRRRGSQRAKPKNTETTRFEGRRAHRVRMRLCNVVCSGFTVERTRAFLVYWLVVTFILCWAIIVTQKWRTIAVELTIDFS